MTMDDYQKSLAVHLLDNAECVLQVLPERNATSQQITHTEAAVERLRNAIVNESYGRAMHEAFFVGIVCGELGIYTEIAKRELRSALKWKVAARLGTR